MTNYARLPSLSRISSKRGHIPEDELFLRVKQSMISKSERSFTIDKSTKELRLLSDVRSENSRKIKLLPKLQVLENSYLSADSAAESSRQKIMQNRNLVVKIVLKRQPTNASLSRLQRIKTKEQHNPIYSKGSESVILLDKILQKEQISKNYFKQKYAEEQIQKLNIHKRRIKQILTKNRIKYYKLSDHRKLSKIKEEEDL